jgi:hypothetical protein
MTATNFRNKPINQTIYQKEAKRVQSTMTNFFGSDSTAYKLGGTKYSKST